MATRLEEATEGNSNAESSNLGLGVQAMTLIDLRIAF
jgi:hypothetical protein